MRLLIDTNLAITYATGRETDPDKDAAIAVIDMCAEGKAEGYLACAFSDLSFSIQHCGKRGKRP